MNGNGGSSTGEYHAKVMLEVGGVVGSFLNTPEIFFTILRTLSDIMMLICDDMEVVAQLRVSQPRRSEENDGYDGSHDNDSHDDKASEGVKGKRQRCGTRGNTKGVRG